MIVIILIIRKVNGGVTKGKYDERQELIRGRGYKYACFTLLALLLIYMAGDATGFIAKLPLTSTALIFTIIMCGTLVYAVYCIVNDAYLSMGTNLRNYTILILMVILLNGASAIMNFKIGAFEDGKLSTGPCMQVVCVIAFAIVLAALFIRKAQTDKEDEDEES